MNEHKVKENNRAEEYEKDPSKFFHQDDIVMAVVKTEKGMATLHGACTRGEIEMALSRLTYKTFFNFQQMDVAAMVKAKKMDPGIILP